MIPFYKEVGYGLDLELEEPGTNSSCQKKKSKN